MLLLIDGYNVLKKAKGARASASEKEYFIKQCAAYALNKNHQVILVFDGGPLPRPTRERLKNITIVHAGFEQTADDYLKQLVELHKNNELLLISSDNELKRFAHHHAKESLGGDLFYQFLQNPSKEITVASQPTKISKFPHASADETLAKIMEEESIMIPSNKRENSPTKRTKKNMASKKEKKLTRLLKKL
jgi:predicted RNA-binding protein with PIN domain